MSLSTSISDLATRVATEFKNVRADTALAGHTHDYAASGHSHSEFATQVSQSMTADYAITPPAAPADNKVQRYELLASGASRNVTVDATIRISTGLTRGPYAVPAGEVCLAAIEWSPLASDWVLTALTVSAV